MQVKIKCACPKCNCGTEYTVKFQRQWDITKQREEKVLQWFLEGTTEMKSIMARAMEEQPFGDRSDKWARNALWRLRDAGVITISREVKNNIILNEDFGKEE